MLRECYVIQICRRDADNPELTHGLVEEVGTKEQKTFGSLNDLRNILCPPQTAKADVEA